MSIKNYFPRGFPSFIVKDTQKLLAFKCRECEGILHKPMQRSVCGHRICSGCYDELLIQIKKNGRAECKDCDIPEIDSSVNEERNMFYDDAGFKREYGCEEMNCAFPSCRESIKYKALDKHLNRCKYRPVPCINKGCGKEVPECELQVHIDGLCPYRTIVCKGCNKSMPASRLPHHEKLYCSQEHMSFPSWTDRCPFLCPPPLEGWTSESLETHREEAVMEHLDRSLAQLQHLQISLQNFIDFPMELVGDVENKAEPSRMNSMVAHGPSTSSGDTDLITSGEAFYREVLSSDPERLLRLLFVFEKNFSEVFRMPLVYRELKEAYDILLKQLLFLKRSDALKTAEIQHLRNQLRDVEDASYNGVMVWRINNWDSVRNRACQGIEDEIRSPVFYTGKFGYKLQLRLYPNGTTNPQARNKFISLHLMVCPGNFDPLLKFPFCQRVTFTLEDQDMRLPIMDTISPSIQVNSSQGSDLFVKLDHLTRPQYIKNDCIFIRCMVDCSNLLHY